MFTALPPTRIRRTERFRGVLEIISYNRLHSREKKPLQAGDLENQTLLLPCYRRGHSVSISMPLTLLQHVSFCYALGRKHNPQLVNGNQQDYLSSWNPLPFPTVHTRTCTHTCTLTPQIQISSSYNLAHR